MVMCLRAHNTQTQNLPLHQKGSLSARCWRSATLRPQHMVSNSFLRYVPLDPPARLLRFSRWLSGGRVAAVDEETPRLLGRDGRKRGGNRLHERLAGAGSGFPKERFELRKSLLDRREVRGVGWQEH